MTSSGLPNVEGVLPRLFPPESRKEVCFKLDRGVFQLYVCMYVCVCVCVRAYCIINIVCVFMLCICAVYTYLLAVTGFIGKF